MDVSIYYILLLKVIRSHYPFNYVIYAARYNYLPKSSNETVSDVFCLNTVNKFDQVYI